MLGLMMGDKGLEGPRVGSFRLQAEGLDRVLGSIEADVMEHVWAAGGPMTIRAVHEALTRQRPLSFNTTVSVVNHLVNKGLLRRERARRGHVVMPTIGREEFLARVSREVAAGLIRDFGELAVTQFLAVLREEDPEALARLQAMLAQEGTGDGPRR